jgi:hypothetical protein
MFFFGMWLGDGRNVYLPHQYEQSVEDGKPTIIFGWQPPTLINNMVLIRLQYAGQFWIGLPAWPAMWNYYVPDVPILEQYYESPGAVGLRHLNDEEREELRRARETDLQEYQVLWQRLVSQYRRRDLAKQENDLNTMQLKEEMGKFWDIAWVYTVIAGVLNVLVIYDAWAGPVRLRPHPPATGQEKKATQ